MTQDSSEGAARRKDQTDFSPPPWQQGLKLPPTWRDGGRRRVYGNDWLVLDEHEAVAPTGHDALYGVMRPTKLAVGVLPIHDDGKVRLVGQHRFPLMNFVWEIPEGGVEAGEAPLTGIKRELAEEAGLTATHWREVLRLETSNSVTDEQAISWIAWGLTPADAAEPDETEALVCADVPFRDVLDAIARHEVRDAITVATVMRAYQMAVEGELPALLSRAMLR